jgi:hypothetical protein
MIEWSKPARNRHFAGYAEVNATTDRRFGHSLAEQIIQIWVTKVSDVFLMFIQFILSMRIPIESFWDSTTMHRGRCSTGLWKLLLEMCRTQLGPTLGVFFLTWVYTTQMALSENIVHCPISWLESLLIVISCHFTEIPIWGIWYNRITNVEFNLFAMP